MPTMMSEKLQNRIALVIILIAVALLLVRYPLRFQSYHDAPPADFAVYLQGWQQVVNGHSPYLPEDPSHFIYSPGVLALAKLLPAFPPHAWLVFSTLCIFGLLVSLIVGARYHTWKSSGL